jgi:hypothetical protein
MLLLSPMSVAAPPLIDGVRQFSLSICTVSPLQCDKIKNEKLVGKAGKYLNEIHKCVKWTLDWNEEEEECRSPSLMEKKIK